MAKKTNKTNKTGDQEKSICDWAYEGLFFDDVQQFLSLCKDDDYEETDMITYREFLALKKKFGFGGTLKTGVVFLYRFFL